MASPKQVPLHPYMCAHSAPSRVWEFGPNGWSSREWKKGEKMDYIRSVLGRPE